MTPKTIKQFIASILSAALILTSLGFQATEAMAQAISGANGAAANAGGHVGAVGGLSVGAANQAVIPALNVGLGLATPLVGVTPTGASLAPTAAHVVSAIAANPAITVLTSHDDVKDAQREAAGTQAFDRGIGASAADAVSIPISGSLEVPAAFERTTLGKGFSVSISIRPANRLETALTKIFRKAPGIAVAGDLWGLGQMLDQLPESDFTSDFPPHFFVQVSENT